MRGGSWNNNTRNVRASCRNRNEPTNRNNNIGFRCVGDGETGRSRGFQGSCGRAFPLPGRDPDAGGVAGVKHQTEPGLLVAFERKSARPTHITSPTNAKALSSLPGSKDLLTRRSERFLAGFRFRSSFGDSRDPDSSVGEVGADFEFPSHGPDEISQVLTYMSVRRSICDMAD